MSRLTRLLAVLLVPALFLAACGTTPRKAAEPTTPALPTSNVTVPQGVDLTKPGASLKFGEAATIAYEPNPQRSSVLQLVVKRVTQGRIGDLGNYVLDQRTRASSVFYVQVSIKNVGDGDVGRAPIPLWLVDSTDTLIQQSSFTNTFKRCPSGALPASFAPQQEVDACLVYLVPDHGTMTGMSFRPLQAFAPIEWRGDLTKVTRTPKKKGKTKP